MKRSFAEQLRESRKLVEETNRFCQKQIKLQNKITNQILSQTHFSRKSNTYKEPSASDLFGNFIESGLTELGNVVDVSEVSNLDDDVREKILDSTQTPPRQVGLPNTFPFAAVKSTSLESSGIQFRFRVFEELISYVILFKRKKSGLVVHQTDIPREIPLQALLKTYQKNLKLFCNEVWEHLYAFLVRKASVDIIRENDVQVESSPLFDKLTLRVVRGDLIYNVQLTFQPKRTNATVAKIVTTQSPSPSYHIIYDMETAFTDNQLNEAFKIYLQLIS